MADDGGLIGDDPLVDGMSLSVRLRRDFSVTDAGRLLEAARRMHRELNPGVSAEEARVAVTCAADALFVVLEHAGLVGGDADSRLGEYAGEGLAVGGWQSQVVPNEPWPLSPLPRHDCLRGDVFALPPEPKDPGS